MRAGALRRGLGAAALTAAVAFALAQTPVPAPPVAPGNDAAGSAGPPPKPTAESIVAQVRPTAAVTVKRHPTGADELEVTLLDAGFPVPELRRIAERVGEETGVPIRGLQIYRSPGGREDLRFLKASFATNGLLDPVTGTVRLQPLARALSGVPAPHTIRGFTVGVTGVEPRPQTLRTFAGEGAVVAGTYSVDPPGLEYRVALVSQDPARISIPDRFEPEPKPTPAASSPGRPAWLVPALLVSAAVAAGFLVYFVTLSMGRPARRRGDR